MPPSKKDPRIDQYIKKAPTFAQPILKHLRKVVRETCPEVKETIKWRAPFFIYREKILCGTGTFKAHCAFFLWHGSLFLNERNKSAKSEMKALRHITALSDLPNSRRLRFYLKQGMQLIESGAKAPKAPPKKKPPVKTPPELMRALRANPKALRVYEAFSPSHQRHYVDWIGQAKTPETHEKRLEKAVECIASGVTRHWELGRG